MAETLGSLCDKLTIVKLKQWHSADAARLASLASQESRLRAEIDAFVCAAIDGEIDRDSFTMPANKVFDIGARHVREFDATAGVGELIAELAHANCALWHEQEKVYEVQKNPASQHDAVSLVERLGVLNLERTRCIDAIDSHFAARLDADVVIPRRSKTATPTQHS